MFKMGVMKVTGNAKDKGIDMIFRNGHREVRIVCDKSSDGRGYFKSVPRCYDDGVDVTFTIANFIAGGDAADMAAAMKWLSEWKGYTCRECDYDQIERSERTCPMCGAFR